MSSLCSAVEGRLRDLWAQCSGGLPFDPNYGTLLEVVDADLDAYTSKDPAAGGNRSFVLDSYGTFAGVLCYRLGHAAMLAARSVDASAALDPIAYRLRVAARQLNDQGKRFSGADIHPGAVIGPGFVLDHAQGTVIGETAVIGANAYVLGGVTLGARGISGNPLGKRHPTLGDRVEIGSGAQILGPIDIGDDVFVSPNAVVTRSVPSAHRVHVLNQLQLCRQPESPTFELFGVVPQGGAKLGILGSGFCLPEVRMLDRHMRPSNDFLIRVERWDDRSIEVWVSPAVDRQTVVDITQVSIRVVCDGASMDIVRPPALRHVCPMVESAALLRHATHPQEPELIAT